MHSPGMCPTHLTWFDWSWWLGFQAFPWEYRVVVLADSNQNLDTVANLGCRQTV